MPPWNIGVFRPNLFGVNLVHGTPSVLAKPTTEVETVGDGGGGGLVLSVWRVACGVVARVVPSSVGDPDLQGTPVT